MAVDATAAALGLRPGMKLAQAQALVPGLTVRDADPAGDTALLRRLAADTHPRVRKAVAKLGYAPNAQARMLRTARSNVIVALVPDISNPFFSEVIRGPSSRAISLSFFQLP